METWTSKWTGKWEDFLFFLFFALRTLLTFLLLYFLGTRIRIGFGSVSDRFDPNSNSDRIGSNPNGFGPDSDQN